MDEKDLTIAALKEQIGTDAQRFADERAQYRVHITMLNNKVDALVAELEGRQAAEPRVVVGEVVDDE